MKKVLFIDTAHPILWERLTDMGYHCDIFPDYSIEDYKQIVHDYEGFIVRSKIPLDKNILPLCKKLRFIGRVGAGMENIDVVLAKQQGIICLNVPEGNRDAVGEHALGMLLSLINRLNIVDNEVRNGIWLRAENRGIEIKGKTVGIIGYGNVGSVFARKLSGLDCEILAYDKYKSGFSNDYVKEATMEEIYDQADIISFHVPLTEETRFMVDATYLSHFKKNIYLVNTSRGPVVRTSDLVDALDNKKVLGACLDVLEFEKFSFEDISKDTLPPYFKRLIEMNNVIFSPHIAGWTHESHFKMANILADKIQALNL